MGHFFLVLSMKILNRLRILPLLALALAAGCSDLGLDSGAGAVTGLTIEDASGNTLVTVSSAGTVSGTLTVPRNGQRAVRISLQGAGGSISPGLADNIRVTLTNSTLVAWDETGTTTGTLVGQSRGAGSTRMVIDLISAGAVEYTSPGIPVQVT